MHAILAVKVHSVLSHYTLVGHMQGFILYVDVGVEAKLFPQSSGWQALALGLVPLLSCHSPSPR